MNCVACNEPMIVLELRGVEIDYCLDCGGIWLDAGELGLLLDDPQAVESLLELPAADSEVRKSKHKCPICRKPMDELALGADGRLKVDRCRSRHGIWFDRGELEQVADLLDQDQVVQLLKEMFRGSK